MNNGFNTTFATTSYKVKIETIGGRVEDFAIEPNEKLTLEADDRALPLNDMTGDYGRYFMQKDKIDGMVHKANELKSSPDPMQRAIGQELVKILKDYGLVWLWIWMFNHKSWYQINEKIESKNFSQGAYEKCNIAKCSENTKRRVREVETG